MRELRRQSRIEEVTIVSRNMEKALLGNILNQVITNEPIQHIEIQDRNNFPLNDTSKSVSRALVKDTESVSSPLVERKQSVSKALVKDTESVSSPLVERKRSVSRALVNNDSMPSISELSKQQDLLINYIFEICLDLGQRETNKIHNFILQNHINTSQGNLRILILGLKIRGFITIITSKNGPSGWRIYQLPDHVYKEILSRRNIERALVERKQSVSNALASPLVNASSSSSSLITTTTELKINTSKLQLTSELILAGFNRLHLNQLERDSKLSSEEIQESLNALTYDLSFEDVKRKIRSPVAMACKLLKHGQVYVSEKGYESNEDRLLREMLERSERKGVEKRKLQERIFDAKFEDWLDSTSDEEKIKIEEPLGEFMGLIHKDQLKNYYKKEIHGNNI